MAIFYELTSLELDEIRADRDRKGTTHSVFM